MPRFAAAHSNLASILKEQGKIDQAVSHYMEAIQIDPRFADAYSNLGNAYKELGRLEDAIKCYDAAINLKPTFSDAYSNLGSAYKDSGRIDDAITCYRQALALRPNFPDAFCNLVHSLVLICDWSSRDADFATLRNIMFEQVGAALTHFRACKPATPASGEGNVVAFPAATTGESNVIVFIFQRLVMVVNT
jgi:protein O-GlcNAc transferase